MSVEIRAQGLHKAYRDGERRGGVLCGGARGTRHRAGGGP